MARHKHGEGSVFQRKDGRWVAQVKLDNGKKKQRYFKTEKEANTALRKMLNEKEQGTLVTERSQTLKVYLDQWLEQVHKPTVRISSYVKYRLILDNHVIPELGHIQLQKLTPQQVQGFYAKKLKGGLLPSTIRVMHVLLHKALDNAVRWNMTSKNVCDLVTPPVPQRHEMQTLTLEQAQRLLDVAHEHKLGVLLTVAVTTGMRCGELLGLHWQDIDFKAKCLHVQRTVGRLGKFGIVESEPKTQRGKRKITLPAFVIESLAQHKKRQQEVREKAGDLWKEKGIVFSNLDGGYMDSHNLYNDFKGLLQRAELPNIRFHDLRHSAATILLGMNVSPKIVQELLGHSNISMTLDIYSHVLPSMQQEMADKLDDLYRRKE